MGDVPYGYCRCGCGQKTWVPKKTSSYHGHAKGVPRPYMKGHNPANKITVTQRLNQHTVDEATGCWLTPVVRRDGYGQISVKGKVHRAHRFYYEYLKGPVPEGLDLDHLCRNRACVNPDHLEPVTRQVNLRRSNRTTLNPDAVREIRKLAADGWMLTDIGRAYGISGQHVGHVVTRKTWLDVL